MRILHIETVKNAQNFTSNGKNAQTLCVCHRKCFISYIFPAINFFVRLYYTILNNYLNKENSAQRFAILTLVPLLQSCLRNEEKKEHVSVKCVVPKKTLLAHARMLLNNDDCYFSLSSSERVENKYIQHRSIYIHVQRAQVRHQHFGWMQLHWLLLLQLFLLSWQRYCAHLVGCLVRAKIPFPGLAAAKFGYRGKRGRPTKAKAALKFKWKHFSFLLCVCHSFTCIIITIQIKSNFFLLCCALLTYLLCVIHRIICQKCVCALVTVFVRSSLYPYIYYWLFLKIKTLQNDYAESTIK